MERGAEAGLRAALFIFRTAVRAASSQLFAADFGSLKAELLLKSASAIVLPIGIAVLGIYKPWGLTAYGRRKQQEPGTQPQAHSPIPLGVKILYTAVALLLVVIIVMHLTGHGMGGHGH